ncbi:MAG TPA: DUF3443 family protein [Steroidobacteraceae bacterium]|jgi:hypothetical protein|nr:DUF3443 family protein [Steroidobacteraceae bacterium]
MRVTQILVLLATTLLSACIGGSGTTAATNNTVPATPNSLTVSVDSGPAAATGAINHAYVTVKICTAGSKTQCASIDHVLLDTGSWGLRLVGSVLAASGVALSGETDAQGLAIEECVTFGGGQTWGPVAFADVSLAGESAAKLPVQIMDDAGTSAPPPAACGAGGTLINGVSGFDANGVLGVGVFAQDCGAACVNAAAPLPIYYGCTAAGVCTAENAALSAQVTNPVAMFAADNNGIIVSLPNLVNANGDASVQGELIFGIATQVDNALPATGLTVLGANASGDFTATYTINGVATALPALIDSGIDSYAFNDPTIAVCATGAFIGYYCPVAAPQAAFAVNSGVGVNNATNTVDFAIADPNTFVANAAAFIDLAGGGGSTTFTWGMPFFYGRKIYIGIDQRVAATYTGPYYAY